MGSNNFTIARPARKYVMVSLGTLGDLDPLLALGLTLRERGHQVIVGTPENLCWRATQFGLEAHRLCGDLSGITANPLRGILVIRNSIPEQLRVLAQISEGSSAIVGSGFPVAAPTAAEYRGVPYVYTAVSPTFLPESGLLPYLGLPAPAWVSRLGWSYQELSNTILFRKALNAYRSKNGMKPSGPVFRDVYQPARRVLAVPPALAGRAAHEANLFVSGFLRVPPDGPCPESVQRFLGEGTPPLIIALGSSRISNVRELVVNLAAAAEKCGLRTLVANSWSNAEIGDLPASVCRAPAAPYSVLFEHAAVVVHHGGAGTFAAALGAGKPQVTVPGFADQGFWAQKAFELGVSPAPVSRSKVTAVRALQAVREVCSNGCYARRAVELRDSGISNDGAESTAEWFEASIH